MRPVNLRAARRQLLRERRPRPPRRWWRAGLLAMLLVLAWTVLATHPWWGAFARSLADGGQRGLGLVLGELEIHGTARLDPAAVREALGFAPGTPMLDLDLDAARERVEALGWVASASVRRELPDRLVVALSEHRPRALWLGAGGPALVAAGGAMLPVPPSEAAVDLPHLVGAGTPPAVDPILRRLADVPDLNARLQRLERIGARRWRLWLRPGVRVELPPGAADAALARLAHEHAANGLLDRAISAVDLRVADRLVVTPLPIVREDAG